MSGISNLIAVTQLKSAQANEDALHGADKARDLVSAQRDARSRLRAFEDMVRDNNLSTGDEASIERMLGELNANGSNVQTNVVRTGNGDFGDVANANNATQAKEIDSVRKRFEDAISDLEAQDKLGNFEIQDLMSRYNQNETLASSVLKKSDDTSNQIIGKV